MNVRTTLRGIRTSGPSSHQILALITGLNVMLELRKPAPEDLTDDTMLYYFEHYPHYMGTKNCEFRLTFGEFKRINEQREQGEYDLIESLEEDCNDTLYAFGNMLDEDWDGNWDKITAALKNEGTWAGQWEEGSHSISSIGMKEARSACALVEAELTEDDDCEGC